MMSVNQKKGRAVGRKMRYHPCAQCGSTRAHCPHHPAYVNGFKARLNLAARCLETGNGISSRAFDNCFEMYDGEIIVTALLRKAVQCTRLREAIENLDVNTQENWNMAAAKFSHIPDTALEQTARQIRRMELPL